MNDEPRSVDTDPPTDVSAWLRGLPRRRKPARLFGTARTAAAGEPTGTGSTGSTGGTGSSSTDTDTDADTRGAG